MTTVPCIGIVSKTVLIADVAASSASSFLPLPIHLADDKAAASVTRTNSIVKLLSIIIPLLFTKYLIPREYLQKDFSKINSQNMFLKYKCDLFTDFEIVLFLFPSYLLARCLLRV